jgi:hypothetical protein
VVAGGTVLTIDFTSVSIHFIARRPPSIVDPQVVVQVRVIDICKVDPGTAAALTMCQPTFRNGQCFFNNTTIVLEAE